MRVVKYGGATMNDPEARRGIASALRSLRQAGERLVIVHGGGPAIGQALAEAGLTNEFVEGRRVTSDRAMPVVEAALTLLGKRISQELGEAVALTGRDAGILQGAVLDPALGRVGRITSVGTPWLEALLGAGLTPILASLAVDADGEALNVNADEAAGAVAGALHAPIVYLSDIPGVLDDPEDVTSVLPSLTRRDVEARIRDGRISGGMIPKVRSALDALDRGAPTARIGDGRTLATAEAALRDAGGTVLVPDA